VDDADDDDIHMNDDPASDNTSRDNNCVIFAPTAELPIAPAFAAGLPIAPAEYVCVIFAPTAELPMAPAFAAGLHIAPATIPLPALAVPIATYCRAVHRACIRRRAAYRACQTRGAAATQTRGAAATQTRGAAAIQTRVHLVFGFADQSIYKVCQGHGLPTQDHGEPKKELCHHHGDRPLVNSIYKMCQGHGLPTQDHGEPKRELCHHHGDRPLVDSICKVCRGTAFLPKIMESPRGSSAIIMEIGC